MIIPTSTPFSSIRFSDNLRILKSYSRNFIITFFFPSSNSRMFLSIVKYRRIGRYSRCDFCSLQRKRLFWRISISFSGSPIRYFSKVRLMKGQKAVLRWLDLQPKEMNSVSLSFSTDPKVLYHVGTLSSSIQNFSRLLEDSDSLYTRVNLSWNSTIFFCSCSRISASLLRRFSQALKILPPHFTNSSSVASNLSTSTISFSRRSLLSAIFSQNLAQRCRTDSTSSPSPSISLRSSLEESRYMSQMALRAGSRIFSIQLVSTFRFSTSPLFSSVSSRATRSKASQMKCSLGFLVRSSLEMDLQKEPQRARVSSKYLMKSLMKLLVYSIFSLQSVCRARRMRVRSFWLMPRACTYCLSFSRLSFLRSAKAMWKSCVSCGCGSPMVPRSSRICSWISDFIQIVIMDGLAITPPSSSCSVVSKIASPHSPTAARFSLISA